MTIAGFRVEHDFLGEMEVPADAYYGIHTARAVKNFSVGGVTVGAQPDLVGALAAVKSAAAQTNADLGILPLDGAEAIKVACAEIIAGALHDHFVVELMQGGAGTSTNMNVNEVVCNRALEHLGHQRGSYTALHPIEHVNLSQSTNDVYPTALRLAVRAGVLRLATSLDELQESFETKAREFDNVPKVGRTQLQDAVPMTLGQEFRAFAAGIGQDAKDLRRSLDGLLVVNLGGTAIGTSVNAPAEYVNRVCRHLRALTGTGVLSAEDLVAATSDVGIFVEVSSSLKRIAVRLGKICDDLRLLASGPQAGFGDLALPAVQAGSSMMPGKINPVIPELVNQIVFQVLGNDLTVTFAAQAGQLQLNAFEPIIARCLFESLSSLTAGCTILAGRCVSGITANYERLTWQVGALPGFAIELAAIIGYEAASELVREAFTEGRPLRDLASERQIATSEAIRALGG